jgi:hypothetical protein
MEAVGDWSRDAPPPEPARVAYSEAHGVASRAVEELVVQIEKLLDEAQSRFGRRMQDHGFPFIHNDALFKAQSAIEEGFHA